MAPQVRKHIHLHAISLDALEHGVVRRHGVDAPELLVGLASHGAATVGLVGAAGLVFGTARGVEVDEPGLYVSAVRTGGERKGAVL